MAIVVGFFFNINNYINNTDLGLYAICIFSCLRNVDRLGKIIRAI